MSSTSDLIQSVKEAVTIHQCVQLLGIQMTMAKDQLRSPCPACRTGGPRALCVTPGHKRNDGSLGSFYCHGGKVGGDKIGLVAHIRNLSQTDAAKLIQEHYGAAPQKRAVPGNSPSPPQKERAGFDIEAYAKRLDPEHEALAHLGVSAETLREFKAGYAVNGVHKLRLALPVSDQTGAIQFYVGLALGDEQPAIKVPEGHDPTRYLFNAHQVEPGDVLYVCRSPIDLLKAWENGVRNIVSFVGPMDSDALTLLAHFMDQNQIPAMEPI
jgi:hypothetical protein